LGFVTGKNERVEPLVDGRVEVEGVELIATHSDPSETFWRQLNFEEFEIAEMSLSSYLIAKSRGRDMIAIPVFPARRFMHTELFYHVDSGIRELRDIVGKRLGVGEYQQTAALSFYLADEVREHNVAVNIVVPGHTRTTGFDEQNRARLATGSRPGPLPMVPEHMVPLVLHLAAQDAARTTGKMFDVMVWNQEHGLGGPERWADKSFTYETLKAG